MTPRGRLLILGRLEIIQDVYADYLANQGYDVDVTDEIHISNRYSDDNQYDVVISDIQLPNHGSGIDAIRNLTASQPNASFILLVGTPNEIPQEHDLSFRTLCRPLGLTELTHAVETAVQESRHSCTETVEITAEARKIVVLQEVLLRIDRYGTKTGFLHFKSNDGQYLGETAIHAGRVSLVSSRENHLSLSKLLPQMEPESRQRWRKAVEQASKGQADLGTIIKSMDQRTQAQVRLLLQKQAVHNLVEIGSQGVVKERFERRNHTQMENLSSTPIELLHAVRGECSRKSEGPVFRFYRNFGGAARSGVLFEWVDETPALIQLFGLETIPLKRVIWLAKTAWHLVDFSQFEEIDLRPSAAIFGKASLIRRGNKMCVLYGLSRIAEVYAYRFVARSRGSMM